MSCGSCDRLYNKTSNEHKCREKDRETRVSVKWDRPGYQRYIDDIRTVIKTYEDCYVYVSIKCKVRVYRRGKDIEHDVETIIHAGSKGGGPVIPYKAALAPLNDIIQKSIHMVETTLTHESNSSIEWVVDIRDR